MSKRVGLALGGGGAKGLAHIAVLETFDEMSIRPTLISGTSIGAIIGAAYAAGRTGRQIREVVERITSPDDRGKRLLSRVKVLRWLDMLSLDLGKGGVVDFEDFLDEFLADVDVRTFEELEIPLKVVATAFWSGEEVVFDKGDVRDAVRASMSLPGIFRPVVDGDRVYVDGGCVNPVPFDLLEDACDVTVAVDVLGRRGARPGDLPSLVDAVFQTYQIMEKTIIREKSEQRPPTIYLEFDISGVRVLEFQKSDQILAEAVSLQAELRRELEAALE